MKNYNIVKKIGKGSFSNVYLCNNTQNQSLLFLSGIYNEINQEVDNNKSFIVKEINTNSLVRKYMVKSKSTINKYITHKKVSGSGSVCITPYSNNLKIALEKFESEEEYYYKKLKDLIQSEIEILKRLSHVNIIKYINSSVNNKIYCIEMEYCQYGDLHTILKDTKNVDFKLRNLKGGFDDTFIKVYLQHTTDGLKYIHDLNIIHRDIKLQNILVKKNHIDDTSSFLFKISDFGFSCFDKNLSESLLISDMDFSSSSLNNKYYKLCGTPYYMAPEIIININKFEQQEVIQREICYDKKVDMWSYGICLYELIFNSLPFSHSCILQDIHDFKDFFLNESRQTLIYEIIDSKKIINQDLKNILKRLLSINSLDRFSSTDLYDFLRILTHNDILITNESIIDTLINLQINQEETKPNEKSPINVNMDSWVIDEKVSSWDKINKASSMIMKVSVDNHFMKWLIKKD